MEESFKPGEEERDRHHQRGDPRESMFLNASMRFAAESEPITVRVRNISAGGMMADCALLLPKGQPVEIELRNIGLIHGNIAWADGQRLGVAFEEPIDPHLVRRPVGARSADTSLVPRPDARGRRPGLKIG